MNKKRVCFLGMIGLFILFATAPGSFAAEVKIALDSPPDLEQSGTYTWAKTFGDALSASGLKATEFPPRRPGGRGGKARPGEPGPPGSEHVRSCQGRPDRAPPFRFSHALHLRFRRSPRQGPGQDDPGAEGERRDDEEGGPRPVAGTGGRFQRPGQHEAAGACAGGFERPAHPGHGQGQGPDPNTSRPGGRTRWSSRGRRSTTPFRRASPTATSTPPIVPVLFKHTDVIKHFSDIKYSAALRLAICSEKWYGRLSEKDRKIVGEAVAKADAANRAWQARVAKTGLEALEKSGVKIVRNTPQERAEFAKLVRPVYAKVVGPAVADQFVKAVEGVR